MKKIFFSFFILMVAHPLIAQDTFLGVYDLLSANCGSCHTPGHESGLTLSGSPAEVYDAIYNVAPANGTSAAKGYKLIAPGDPYKSFLFSKINNGLALDVNLSSGEGEPCPQGGAPVLDNKEIELIRQWIIYGAFETGAQVDTLIIETFYDGGGLQSIESIPAPPAEGEGFQIHYGPWFLWPESEHEFWSKFATQIPEDQEINRVDVHMGEYSHHFIIYKYDAPTHVLNPFGLRSNDPEFLGVSLVTANQFSYDLVLPPNTAFPWEADTWLDLNSHYINYSSSLPLACEVYVNVYTQPSGVAIQEMHSELPANTDIYIPNDGEEYTFEQPLFDNGGGEIFLWGVSSHTHRWGSDYNVYLRNSDGSKGEQIFDASCQSTEGIPGCIDEIYDYQHPPIRYWDTFLPLNVDDGIIHEASYINNGDVPVYFGLTSADEMMVLIYFYLEDTTGLNLPASLPEQEPLIGVQLYPNPASDVVYMRVDQQLSADVELLVSDVNGRTVYDAGGSETAGSNFIQIHRNGLPDGLYVVQLRQNGQIIYSDKLLFH